MKRSKYFTVDFQEQTIIGSKSAIEKAGRIGSPQYKELCEVIKAHPNFKITEKAIKTKKDKATYHGLTFDTMRDYIQTQPDSEKNLLKFEAVQRIAKAKNSLYPLTKKWFLNTFPSYKENSVEEIEKEAAAALKKEAEAEVEKELEMLEDDNEQEVEEQTQTNENEKKVEILMVSNIKKSA